MARKKIWLNWDDEHVTSGVGVEGAVCAPQAIVAPPWQGADVLWGGFDLFDVFLSLFVVIYME
jgi:hypothetical protein